MSGQTATEALRSMEDDRDTNRLNMAMRDFIKRFEPEERRDRLDFEMALHHLVREVYREASKPYEKALMSSAMMMPTASFFVGSQVESAAPPSYPPKL